MKYYIDTIDNRNKILFDILKRMGEHVQSFDIQAKDYEKGDTLVFAPSKKFDKFMVEKLPNNVVIFAGKMQDFIIELFKQKHIVYHNLMEDETFAIKNANLTCEGVLAIILQESQKSIFLNNVLILGAGRIAKGMCVLFGKLGVKYSLASFNKTKFAQNYIVCENNYFSYDFVRELSKFDIIINTIPAEIIDSEIIEKIAPNTVFIETASTNCLDKSKTNHFKYIEAPALPQRFACQTAGELMLDCVLGNNIN